MTMTFTRLALAALTATGLAFAAGSSPAAASGWYVSSGSYYGHGHGHHRHGHGYGRGYGHRHHGSGVSLGFVFVQPVAPAYPPPRPVLVAPPPRAAYDCKPTTGTGYANGQPALYGGTWCTDQYGAGYVVAGSEYFIRYLN
jgi:hypothetical protein